MSTSATPPTSPTLDIAPQVRQAVAARGYRVVDDPHGRPLRPAGQRAAGRAQLARPPPRSASDGGFGGTLLGGAAGGAAGYGLGAAGLGVNDTLGAIGGALAGAAIAGLADAYVQDTTYTIVTDIQVAERHHGRPDGQPERAGRTCSQGSSGTLTQSSSSTTDAQALPHADRQHRQPGQPRLGGGRSRNWSPA